MIKIPRSRTWRKISVSILDLQTYAVAMAHESKVGTRCHMLSPFLNERTHHLAAAPAAAAIDRGGISRMSQAVGVSRRAIRSGLAQRTRLQP